jgi:tRNA(fMet)-specific endonuclease VapC
MTYLIDTDWVASYLNGRADAIQLLNSVAPSGIAISLITYGEIYDGIYHGKTPKAAERGFLQFLRTATVLPLNRSIMKRFAQVRGDLRRAGQTIADTDVLIGATALHYQLELVTRNVRHFQRIPQLKLYHP